MFTIDSQNRVIYNGITFGNRELDMLNEHISFLSFLKSIQMSEGNLFDYLKNNYTDYRHRVPSFTPNISLSISKQKNIAKKFYSEFNPNLGEKVKSILSGKNSDYHLSKIKHGESFVNHHGFNDFVTMQVGFNGQISGLETLAHELSHAISNHHTARIEKCKKLKNASSKDEFEAFKSDLDNYNYTFQQPEHDCVGEIESHIIEPLFLRYLIKNHYLDNKFDTPNNLLQRIMNFGKKHQTPEEYFVKFLEGKENYFNNNISTILNEEQVLKDVPKFIGENRFEDFANYLNNLPKDKQEKLLSYIQTNVLQLKVNKNGETYKIKGIKKPKHVFRYVIGEIISKQWLDNYEKGDKQTREEMRKNFAQYLSLTDSINVFEASKFLINLDLVSAIENYFTNYKKTESSIN